MFVNGPLVIFLLGCRRITNINYKKAVIPVHVGRVERTCIGEESKMINVLMCRTFKLF